jgi:hypothetical protein
MHGHMSRCTVTCHDARSHERKFHEMFFMYDLIVKCVVKLLFDGRADRTHLSKSRSLSLDAGN